MTAPGGQELSTDRSSTQRDLHYGEESTGGAGDRQARDTHPGPPAAAAGEFLLGGDLPVRRMGYGSMQLTGPMSYGPPRDRAEALAVLRRAVELGITLIDTADIYGPGIAEELIADALHPYPQDVVIATKGGVVHDSPASFRTDGRPEHLRAACEASLRRLRLERIDLYQLHRLDPRVPLEDSVGALAELRDEGKIAHIGLSEVGDAELARAEQVTPIASVQNMYNLAERGSERLLTTCEDKGIAFLPWFPLATGQLARAGGPLDHLASRHGATPAQLALAWLLARSPVVLPIPGTSSVHHLEQNTAAAQLHLAPEELHALTTL